MANRGQFFKTHKFKCLLFGLLFGSAYPFLAAWVESIKHSESFLSELWAHDDLLRLILDTTPFFLGILGFVAGHRQDLLTQKKRKLMADLNESRNFLSAIVNNLPIALFCKDYKESKGQFVEWNRAAEKMWDLTRSQVIGKTDFDLFSMEQAETFRARDIEAIQAQGTLYQPQIRIQIPNRQPIEARLWKTHVKETGDNTRYVLGLCMDISEQVAADKQLRETRNLLEQQRMALDASAIVTITDTQGKIFYANAKFQEVSGFSDSEVIGQDHRILNSGFHSADFFLQMWQTLLEGKIWKGEIRNKRKSGEFFWVDTTIVPLKDVNGKITHFVSIHNEITTRKEAEVELQLTREKALAAAAAKSTFLANMSHEIRTPLTGILGICALIDESIYDKNLQIQLELIRGCGLSLLELLNDVLDFSKLEAQKLSIEQKPFALKRMVEELLMPFQIQAREKNVKLEFFPAQSTPDWITGDPMRLRQVLTNLVSNALKFTSAGSIEIRSEAREMPDGIALEFAVSDTGIGISSKVKNSLFQAFSQADESTTRKFGGTGLGLAICKGICEQMGGKIWVESELGKGSIFRFVISVKPAIPQSEIANSIDTLAHSLSELAKHYPLRILVAEDNHVNQIVILGYLEKMGYKADLACDGASAVEMANRQFYDLIFMDCLMPGMDGYEASKQLRESSRPWKKKERIVAITASSSKDQISRCMISGMDEVINKPADPKALVLAIKRASPASLEKAAPGNFSGSIDSNDLMHRFQGMEEVAYQMLNAFVAEAPKKIEQIRLNVRNEDAKNLELNAHSIRSILSYVNHKQSVDLASKLERMGREKNLEEASHAVDLLQIHVEDLCLKISSALRDQKTK